MSAVVSLSLRNSGTVYEDVDLDALSPRARALAEAIAQHPLRSRSDIWMEHETPIRDCQPDWPMWYTPEEAARPERRPWRGWASYPDDSRMPPVEYLEREARRIPPDWHVLGYRPDTPVPSAEAGAADRRMTLAMVLTYLRERGRPVADSTWRSYVARDQAPRPADRVERTPLWDQADIDAWLARQ